jgi:transposase
LAGGEKWHDGVPDIVRRLAGRSKAGLTDDEVAEHLGVAVRTVHRWKEKYPEFRKALIETKALLDSRVELNLFRRATGYRYTEIETTLERNSDGELVETKRIVREKEALPDVNALRLWLTNRDAASWRDKQEVEHSGTLSWTELVKSAADTDEGREGSA